MTRQFGLGALLMSMLGAACGSSVETSGTTGGGGGGSGGAPICAQEAFPCCQPGQSDPCCAQCAPPTKSCGPNLGVTCADDEYCDFTDDQCGGNDGNGVCKPKPSGCTDEYFATCGCDGMIHGNPCDAQFSGTDASNLGGCTPPPGMFGCGAHFCTLGAEYCEQDLPATSGTPNGYVCRPLPAACGGIMPSCTCLAGASCGTNCVETTDGGQMLTCVDG